LEAEDIDKWHDKTVLIEDLPKIDTIYWYANSFLQNS